jgi:hypothetical protein
MRTATIRAVGLPGAIAVVAALLLTGCAAGSQSQAASPSPTASSAAPGSAAPAATPSTPALGTRGSRPDLRATRAPGVPADVPMPNRALTPGAIQSSDTAAICTPGWAAAHRDVSDATKDFVAREYGLSSRSGYEIDHLIPLEIGGSNSVSNLWPEPYNSPYGATQKDGLEDYLREQVCYHGMPLATAQREIAADWYTAWVAAGRPTPQDFGYNDEPGSTPTTAQSPGQTSGAWCTAAASYNSSYNDYDVYVHSNQPEQAVTASSGSYSHTYYTDSSGYADVYLKGPSPGDQITVQVGAATCSATA